MIFAVDPATAIAGIAGAIASVLATVALILQRRTEGKSVSKDEMQSAFEAQDKILDRVEKDNERLRERNDELHVRLNSAFADFQQVQESERECRRHLAELENRIKSLEENRDG